MVGKAPPAPVRAGLGPVRLGCWRDPTDQRDPTRRGRVPLARPCPSAASVALGCHLSPSGPAAAALGPILDDGRQVPLPRPSSGTPVPPSRCPRWPTCLTLCPAVRLPLGRVGAAGRACAPVPGCGEVPGPALCDGWGSARARPRRRGRTDLTREEARLGGDLQTVRRRRLVWRRGYLEVGGRRIRSGILTFGLPVQLGRHPGQPRDGGAANAAKPHPRRRGKQGTCHMI